MFKKIKKIVIPAAGWGTRFLPLTKIMHKELVPILNKPIIHFLIEEIIDSGIEEVVLIVCKRKLEIIKYFEINKELENQLFKKGKIELLHEVQKTNSPLKINICIQNEQLGLGHAISQASDIIGNEPFGVILGDDLVYSKNKPAIKQLIDIYNKKGSSIIGVQEVKEDDIEKYGIIIPKNNKELNNNLFKIKGALEKPNKKEAPSNKAILGRYIFTPEILSILKKIQSRENEEINVVDAFDELIKMNQDIYAFSFKGQRYDLGSIEGFVKANIDYSLRNPKIKNSILDFIKEKIKK